MNKITDTQRESAVKWAADPVNGATGLNGDAGSTVYTEREMSTSARLKRITDTMCKSAVKWDGKSPAEWEGGFSNWWDGIKQMGSSLIGNKNPADPEMMNLAALMARERVDAPTLKNVLGGLYTGASIAPDIASLFIPAGGEAAAGRIVNGLSKFLSRGSKLAKGADALYDTERGAGALANYGKRSIIEESTLTNGAGKTFNKLPKTTAESVRAKLDTYLLEPTHPVGGSKAKWFKEALGFTKDNSVDLAKQIMFDPKKAVQTATNAHGTKFSQVISVQGANGNIIDVEFIFIKNNDGIIRLVTSIPTKR